MKKVIAILALMASATAFAQSSSMEAAPLPAMAGNNSATGSSNSQSNEQSGKTNSNANAGAVSGSQAVTGNIGCLVNCASTDQGSRDLADGQVQSAAISAAAAIEIARINSEAKIRNTPSVSGSPLVSSNDTCMGSSSGSVNAPGIGISLGSTWVDENCKMLKNSRELWNMGMKAASLALMCNDAANREALEMTGFECPQTTKAKKQAAAQAAPMAGVSGYTGNDPIVLERLASK